jgi:hypothetical protein
MIDESTTELKSSTDRRPLPDSMKARRLNPTELAVTTRFDGGWRIRACSG